MNQKFLLLLNLAWAVIAVGAFVIGRSGHESNAVPGQDRMVTASGGSGTRAGGLERASEASSGESLGGGIANGRFEGGVPDGEKMGKLLARALNEKNPILRKQQLGNLLANLTMENIPTALKAFEEGPKDEAANRAFGDFLYAWGALDGPAAIAYAMDEKAPRKTRYGSIGVMTAWATSDLGAARAFVDARETDDTKTWLHYGVFKTVLDRDLDMAVQYAAENTRSRSRGYAMDRLAGKLMETGGAEALKNWIDGIDHTGENDMESYKAYALRIGIDKIGRKDPDLAKAWIEENFGQPYVDVETMRRAAWAVGGGEAGRSMDWLTTLPAGEDQSRALGELVEHHANRNPNAVAEWLNERKDSPQFDTAASQFAQHIVDDDPVSAIAWAQSIHESERRDKTLRKVIKSWQKEDPAAAEAWVRENS